MIMRLVKAAALAFIAKKVADYASNKNDRSEAARKGAATRRANA